MVCPGGGLRPPHPHFQSAASAASENGFIFRKWVQNMFFHEWAPYRRWGGHRTVEIQVVAMRVFFIPIISQKKNGFPARGRFHYFPSVFDIFDPKWPRSVWEWSGGIPDLFQAILDPFWQKIGNRLKIIIMNNHIKIKLILSPLVGTFLYSILLKSLYESLAPIPLWRLLC